MKKLVTILSLVLIFATLAFAIAEQKALTIKLDAKHMFVNSVEGVEVFNTVPDTDPAEGEEAIVVAILAGNTDVIVLEEGETYSLILVSTMVEEKEVYFKAYIANEFLSEEPEAGKVELLVEMDVLNVAEVEFEKPKAPAKMPRSSKKPSTTEVPTTEVPTTEVPTTEVPISEPPISEPPISEPPISEPPISEPPTETGISG